jgi:hypothetical protein
MLYYKEQDKFVVSLLSSHARNRITSSLYWNRHGNCSLRNRSEISAYTYLKIERRAAPPDRKSSRVGLSGGEFSIEARSRRSKTPEEAELSASTVKECQWVASSRARIASNISPIDGSKRTSRGLSSCKTEIVSGVRNRQVPSDCKQNILL